jgi:oligopeptide transport system substrate-binding protein
MKRLAIRIARAARVAALVSMLAAACAPVAADTANARLVGDPSGTSQSATPEVRLPLQEPPTLDPAQSTDLASVDVISQLFDGLVAPAENGAITPVGAESWTVSPDGLTYTFTLRKGAAWSDGRPVTAADYAYAWKRIIDPATASPFASSLTPLANGQAIISGELDPEQLGVHAVDDRVLVVTLDKPAAYFLSLASTPALYPLRQDIVEQYGKPWTEAASIVGNGAYVMTAWDHDTRIVLERNEGHWGPKPAIQRAMFRLLPEGDGDALMAAYEAGEIDTTGAGAPAELRGPQIDRVMADPVLRTELRSFVESSTALLAVNHRRPYLQDARVRQAIGMVLERQWILEITQQAGDPAFDLQPIGIVGRQPSLWPRESTITAQRLMAEAGYPNGQGFPEITLTYSTPAPTRLLAEYVQSRLKETLGITVRTEFMSLADYLPWLHADGWREHGDLARISWFSDYEEPENWYNRVWDSANDPDALNGGWHVDRFDDLVRQAAGELDSTRRAALYAQADQILAREYPHIPLYHYEFRALVKPYLRGYTPARVLGVTPLRTMSVAAKR